MLLVASKNLDSPISLILVDLLSVLVVVVMVEILLMMDQALPITVVPQPPRLLW